MTEASTETSTEKGITEDSPNIKEPWLTPEKLFWGMLILTGVLIAGYLGYFFGYLKYVPSNDPGDWGTFGDFVGGLINPLIGLAGLYMLVITLRQNHTVIQNSEKELKLTREELTESRKAQQSIAETEGRNLDLSRYTAVLNVFQSVEQSTEQLINELLGEELDGTVIIQSLHELSFPEPCTLEHIISTWEVSGRREIFINEIVVEDIDEKIERMSPAIEARIAVLVELAQSLGQMNLTSEYLLNIQPFKLALMLRKHTRVTDFIAPEFPHPQHIAANTYNLATNPRAIGVSLAQSDCLNRNPSVVRLMTSLDKLERAQPLRGNA